MAGQFIVVRSLSEAIERRAREELGAAHHALQMIDGHGLALRHTMYIDVGGETVLDPLALQCVLQCRQRPLSRLVPVSLGCGSQLPDCHAVMPPAALGFSDSRRNPAP